jgi:hypothetical protein
MNMARQYPDALPTGYSLQEYTVRRVLGQGGFGITYLAYDEGLAKEVAIKEYFPVEFASRHADDTVSPRSDADNDDYDWGLDRFQDEARTLVLFRHPAIVPVYRRFEENGTAYMVMEYQQGEALSELMKRHLDDFTESDLMNIAGPVLDGLAEVHKAGYMHRDLKPGNIYIRRDGSPVLLDFGAARAAVNHKSKSLTSIVTPGYAPLEQYFAEGNQGPWTDIYAFAALLYQCVCGKLPPEAPARVRNDKMVSAVEVGDGRFTEHFLKAIDAGLAINEEDRPQSVAAWHGLLIGQAPERKRRPDETVALVGGRAKTPAPAKPANGKAKAAVGVRQEPSFKQPALDRPGGEATGGGRGGVARIAIFAVVGILLAGAGAAGGWLAVGGGESGPVITDGTGNGNGNGVGNGNGNGNGGNGTNTALTPEEKRQKALEEARRKAQEAARRKAQEEADRRRREETDRQRKARLEAERRQKARQEADRRRKAEAERKRQADADRKRKAELERQRRQREEAERKRREADAKRKAREEAERKRKAREEAERKRRELAAKNTIVCPYLAARIRGVATTRRDCGLIAVTYRQALTNGYPGVTRGWRNRQSGARGTITILRSIKRPNGTFCRVFQQTVVFGGAYRRGTGTACLFGNQWRIVG